MEHAYNPSTQQAETRQPQGQGHSSLHNNIFSKTNQHNDIYCSWVYRRVIFMRSHVCVYVPACACTHACNRGKKKKNGHWDHGAGVIGSCGPLNIGVENQTQVLWKSGKPFSWLTHLNSSKKVSHIHTGVLYLGAKVQLVKTSQVCFFFFNVFISLTEILGVKGPVTI